ncbi:uncharacterized protein BJX67DRAFT_329308 [Aspergillus lucknowensis]|uniref:Uncharacterized protein n=1 Tax=Aspergillus lucknowensis TaxID=176173 RepID=A0ABR4L8A5_9EURO
METITHAVQNASHAFWDEVDSLRHTAGEQRQGTHAAQHGEEPISGVQGKGTATDPYDSGNKEEQPSAEEPLSGVQGTGTALDPYDAGNRDEQAGAPKSKANTAVGSEPVSSITPTLIQSHGTIGTSQSIKEPQNEGTALATAAVGSTSPGNARSEPVQSEQWPKSVPSNAAVAGGTSAKDTSIGTVGNAPTSQSAADIGTTEQRNKQGDSGATGGASSTPRKQQVSEEALRGPKVPPPRDTWAEEEEEDERRLKQQEGQATGQPKTMKPGESGNNGHHGKESKGAKGTKQADEHHHKTMKERLHNIVKPGHH